MNPVPLFLIIVSLPLLLGGCGEKPVAETKPVEEKVLEVKEKVKFIEFKEVEKRDDGLWYRKMVETPYSGGTFTLHSNGKKKSEAILKNGLLNGKMKGWYPNGQKATEVNFQNGKMHGLKIGWHSNGKKATEAHFKQGKQHGVEKEWYSSGEKWEKKNYKNGKLDGEWIIWNENGTKFQESTFDYGKQLSFKNWNKQGKLETSLNETDFTPVGTANFAELEEREDGLHYKRGDKNPYSGKVYESNFIGRKTAEGSFKNGLKDGLWIEWESTDQRKSQRHYKGGKLHGISTYWGPQTSFEDSGELSRENYEEGKLVELPEKAAGLVNLSDLRMGPHGWRVPSSKKEFSGAVFSLHYSNGKKYQQGTLAEGKRDGVWLEWYENGAKYSELTYKSGKLLSSLTWKPNGEKSKNGIINANGILKRWHENGRLATETKIVEGNELVIRGWDSDGKFKGSYFSNYYENLDTETITIEARIEFRKEGILELEKRHPKDEAKKLVKEIYLELSELEKKLTQIKTEISSIKEIKEQWDKEAEVE